MKIASNDPHGWLRVNAGVLLILVLAFSIQLYHLDARTFHGDELNSLAETEHLGQNLNGILYFAMMHLWAIFATSEFWLRIPSALFAVSTAAVAYRLGMVLANRRTGLLMSLMFATAPFVVEYAQQDRFYSLFLLVASLTYLSFVLSVHEQSRRNLVFLLLTNLLVLGAHFFGILVILSEVLVSLTITRRLSIRFKSILSGALIVFFVVLLVSPEAQSFIYYWVARITDPYGDPTYTGPRGISIANVAKIPLTYFFFGFGENVYPFNLLFVVPGIVVLSIVGFIGVWLTAKRYRVWMSLVLSLCVLPALLFLVFDPMSPPDLQGAAPRYLIFLLPLFYFVLAIGVQHKKTTWLILPLLLVNLGSLLSHFYSDWAYTDDRVDWRALTQWTDQHMTAQTGFVFDGRSKGLADYYFPAAWKTADRVSGQVSDPRVILLSNDFHADARTETSAEMDRISRQYDQTAAWGKYPLFEYVYDRKQRNPGTYPVDADGRVLLPTEIYGLEFQDLRLPLPLAVNGRTLQSLGAFGLPGLDKQMARTIALEQPTLARRVWLMSNVTGAELEPGAMLAVVRIIGADGSILTFPLRAGIETNAWNSKCQPVACLPAFTWRKRLALVGSEGYPGSWQEFDASIFAGELDLRESASIRSMTLERVASPGKFYVWGIALEP